jgi:hypothetical protein
MKTFLVIVEQAGEGCDYSIGCGKTVSEYSGESLEEVRKNVLNEYLYGEEGEINEWNSPKGERALSTITIVEAAGPRVVLDMPAIFEIAMEKAKKTKAEKAAAAREKAEKAEYERLKKKFG